MANILLVEDDPKISSFVIIGLESNNCRVDNAFDSAMGERLALTGKYDVIILDVIIPGITGFDLCKKLRNHSILTPIIMLTSLDTVEDNRNESIDEISRENRFLVWHQKPMVNCAVERIQDDVRI